MPYTLYPKTVITKLLISQSFDPWYNLALEEYLLKRVEENEIILYLWQNNNTVVIGNNQNPWKECRCKELEDKGGKLARRLSGGGAVFHDMGNLNFTFIMPQKFFDMEQQHKVILKAVRDLGIPAVFSGRNDLTVDGKKFSGNAYYFNEHAAYHHGTILINTNLNNLVEYLQVSEEKISSKGIDSIRSRVINLKSIEVNLNVETMINSLMCSFAQTYKKPTQELKVDDRNQEFLALHEKYSSWEWRYGQSPAFDIDFQTRFPWGGIEIGLMLKKGVIVDAVIYSDAMNSILIKKIAENMKGLSFKMEVIARNLKSLDVNQEDKLVIDDISNWLFEKKL